MTGVVILPQRQTALVAKQAAAVDVLSAGRLRLGVGMGWNHVEYEALNEDFHNRGKRIEEQIALMRRLWSDPLVTYKGKWHSVRMPGSTRCRCSARSRSGLEAALKSRCGAPPAWGDGWITLERSAALVRPALDMLARFIEEAGRERSQVGLEARISYKPGDPNTWEETLRAWQAVGATHLSINTMSCGFKTPRNISMPSGNSQVADQMRNE